MAFVPDTSIERMSELSDSAFKMFVYFCKRRNKDTGVCFPSLKTTAADCGLNYSYASVIRKELVSKNWIELIDERVIKCLMGFVISKDNLENPNNLSEKEFGNSKDSLKIPNSPLEIPKGDLEFPNSPYKEVLNQDTQPNQLTKKKTDRRGEDTTTKLPVDFSISKEMRGWAKDKVPNVDIDNELEEFCAFWQDIAVRNNKRTAKGWIATWQNRMRDIQKRFVEKNGATNGTNQFNRFSNGNGTTKSTAADIIKNRSYR